ncbi:14294_t:CDS:2, partial [Ambispora leptoticha]
LTFIGDLACTEKRQNQFAKAWPLFAQSQKTNFPSFDPPYLEFARIRVEDSSGLAQSLDEYGYGIVIREKPFAEGLLREVTHAKYFSRNVLPGSYQSYNLWIPLTDEPDNFVTLGSFLYNSNYGYKYALDQNKGLVGVHRSVCISGVRGSYVKGNVWRIALQDDTIDINAFVADDNTKPELPVWLLRSDMAELVKYVN